MAVVAGSGRVAVDARPALRPSASLRSMAVVAGSGSVAVDARPALRPSASLRSMLFVAAFAVFAVDGCRGGLGEGWGRRWGLPAFWGFGVDDVGRGTSWQREGRECGA